MAGVLDDEKKIVVDMTEGVDEEYDEPAESQEDFDGCDNLNFSSQKPSDDTDEAIVSTKEPFCNSACVAEHKIHYDIYYNELKLFYQKTTIFTTIQLGMFTGLILKYDDLKVSPWIMSACLIFLMLFSVLELLVSIRGNHVNNAVIETIAKFEKDTGFIFLSEFEKNVHKGRRIKTMNFPSLMIVGVNILFLGVWVVITADFVWSLLEPYLADISWPTTSIDLNLPEIVKISALSILFSVTMKIADLLDEHGLKWFKHAEILFGVLWGVFGALLAVSDEVIANVLLAMMMGFVVRKRLDYTNHIIAFAIIVSTIFWYSKIIPRVFLAFFVTIVVLGLIKDLKYNQKKNKFSKFIEKVYLYIPLIYALPSLVYSILYGNWNVFIAFFLYDFAYNITRIVAKKRNWYTDK